MPISLWEGELHVNPTYKQRRKQECRIIEKKTHTGLEKDYRKQTSLILYFFFCPSFLFLNFLLWNLYGVENSKRNRHHPSASINNYIPQKLLLGWGESVIHHISFEEQLRSSRGQYDGTPPTHPRLPPLCGINMVSRLDPSSRSRSWLA